MKKVLLLLIFIYFIPNIIKAQNDTVGKSNYRCTFILENSKKALRGEIYLVNDSFIIFKHIIKRKKSAISKFELVNISVNKIKRIKVIKRGMPRKGLLFGGAYGLVLGGTIGFLSGDDNPANYFSATAEGKAIVYGITLFIPGSLFGYIAGNAKLQMSINGKYENYIKRKAQLIKYSIKK